MFNRDILLIDLEATGLNPNSHEIIQLGAVLLDKKTLKEKKSFVSYVASKKWQNRDPEAMKVNKITKDMLKDAPTLKEVITKFNKTFSTKNVVFAYYGGPVDTDFMRAAYKKLLLPFPFDYHFFNIWGLFYSFFALKGKLNNKKKFTGFTLEDAMKYFKIPAQERHDALIDARIEAQILRKIIKGLK